MQAKNISLEQGITYLVIALLIAIIGLFLCILPGFKELENRTEQPPKKMDEAYTIALNAAGESYPVYSSRGDRHPFLPYQSYRVKRTPRPLPSWSRRTWTRPSRIKTSPPKTRKTPPPHTPSPRVTPTPFRIPVTFMGTYRASEDSPRMVILRINDTGECFTVGLGATVAGMKVLEITPVYVLLQAPSGKKYRLDDPRALDF